jgi:hypothetical protein
MPTWTSLAAYERELARFGKELETSERRKITMRQAEAAQQIAREVASADLGGDPKFSGWAPELATQAKSLRTGATLFSPTRFSAGPWTVAEFGRNSKAGPRMVGPRLTKKGRVSRAKVKRWNGRTEGKQTGSKTLQSVDRVVEDIALDSLRRTTRKYFDID